MNICAGIKEGKDRLACCVVGEEGRQQRSDLMIANLKARNMGTLTSLCDTGMYNEAACATAVRCSAVQRAVELTAGKTETQERGC